MERAVTASQANQQFSDLLRRVAKGETVTVTSRGRPIARMAPVDDRSGPKSVRQLLSFVEQLPVRYAGDWSRDDLYE